MQSATFVPLVGDTVSAHTPLGEIRLELVEAKPLPSMSGAPRQDPFALLFRAAPDCPLGQGPARLEHASLDDVVDAFLVPMMPEPDARYYEAIFN